MGQRVDVVGGVEVDPVDQVDDIPKKVSGKQAVVSLFEHSGENVPRIPRPSTCEIAQVREQIVVDELQERLSRQPLVRVACPVAPTRPSLALQPAIP